MPGRRCCPPGALLGALGILALLQLLYLALLGGLPGPPPPPSPHRHRPPPQHHLKEALAGGGQLDASGQYRVYRDLLGPGEGGNEAALPAVLLATHASLGQLGHLRGLAARWGGPMSLAVFAPTPSAVRQAGLLLYALGTRCPHLQLHAHLVCPAGHLAALPDLPDPGEFARLRSCAEVHAKLAAAGRGETNYALPNASYPNNLLRNVARGAAAGGYALVLDIDMVPSRGLRPAFLALLGAPGGIPGPTGVFVLPAFEIQEGLRPPGTKQELLAMYQAGEARGFYAELCPRCQAPTDYPRWLGLPPAGTLSVTYTVAWRDPWEPFYLGPAAAPTFDERFRQYGFNRISQVGAHP